MNLPAVQSKLESVFEKNQAEVLENQAYRALPDLLARDFGIVVIGRLRRRFVTDNRGREIEVNILGKGKRNGSEVTIIGESKSQLSRNDVNRFIRRKLKRLEGVFGDIFPLLITRMTTGSDVEAYAREQGLAVYYSYDF